MRLKFGGEPGWEMWVVLGGGKRVTGAVGTPSVPRPDREREEGTSRGIRIPGKSQHPIFQLGALTRALRHLPVLV